MKINQVQLKKSEVVTDILCDCCGKSCKVYECEIQNDVRIDNGEMYYDFEYLKLEANWGYNSRKDTENWSAQICESCVDEKLSFIKFHKKNINYFDNKK